MLKHVAVSPHRARADSVSLASSASCCSLGSLEHRHDSVTDLSHRTVSSLHSYSWFDFCEQSAQENTQVIGFTVFSSPVSHFLLRLNDVLLFPRMLVVLR